MKRILCGFFTLLMAISLGAQPKTHPLQGINKAAANKIALTDITLIPEPGQKIVNATLILENGKVLSSGTGIPIPTGFRKISLKGAWVYPGLIELWAKQNAEQESGSGCWNPAVHPQTQLSWSSKDSACAQLASQFRQEGFTTLLVSPSEGIFRGKATLTHTGNESEALEIISEKAAAFLSMEKGKSPEEYPSSLMGAMALIRQTLSDANWYASNPNPSEYNPCLQSLQDDRKEKLPFFFEATTVNDIARIQGLSKEFSQPFIIKGTGREYERVHSGELAGSKLIIPLNFPLPPSTDNWEQEKKASLFVLRHWAWATANAAELEKNGYEFCFSSEGLKSLSQLRPAIRKSIDRGLSADRALAALTTLPAAWLGMQGKLGCLKPGASADLAIFSGDIFDPETYLLETWVQGKAYPIASPAIRQGIEGVYSIKTNSIQIDTLHILKQGKNLKAEIKDPDKKTQSVKIEYNTGIWEFSIRTDSLTPPLLLQGVWHQDTLSGRTGNNTWTAVRRGSLPMKAQEVKKDTITLPPLPYPNRAWGLYEVPKAETWLIKNVQVWTNVADSIFSQKLGITPDTTGGILRTADVLISDGKIQQVGKQLSAPNAQIIDGKGLHLTPGIIDEHSHIAIERGVNEGTQAITAEVRIGDAVRAEDLNIFRQLAGGVTTSQLLHGSANPIGGQSAIIKLRWGMPATEMIMKEAPPFIKFALGENVKQSNWGDRHTSRFPQSRPGVEQIIEDGFQRALVYEQAQKAGGTGFRRDLELETLVEILRGKRFITCHSYVQSEITMLMRLAEKYNFRINTFTHVLEGYKIADKIKAHGASASSFSDWWAYKYEVIDAIPYNGALLTEAGVNTGFNSDDAEMGRRLNQEAAKAVKYGGLSEAEALKLVTLNPAKMLKIDALVGSIEPGKQADVVLWSDHPLSVYARAMKTWVDGKLFYDVEKLPELQTRMMAEKEWLLQRARQAGKNGTAEHSEDIQDNYYHCETLEQEAHEYSR